MRLTEYEFGQALDHHLAQLPTDDRDDRALIPQVEAEFNEFEQVGTRDPREFLLDGCADEVVWAAHLISTGHAEAGQLAFASAIKKARAKYVQYNLSDYAEEMLERRESTRRAGYDA